MQRIFGAVVIGAGLATACAWWTAPSVQAARPLDFANYRETISSSKVSFDMIAVRGGVFTMGSPAAEVGREASEGPQHKVEVRDFWMGKCEVTWEEYDLFFKQDPAERRVTPADKAADAVSRPTAPYVDETYGHDREGHPAICMSHHAAMEYCRWLSVKTGKTYRLPTEAEWEYACRAGTKTAYFFGDDPKPLDQYAWYGKNSNDTTHKVGSKKPNPWGLHDMYGNVYEWCLDHYEKDGYQKFSADKPTLGPIVMPTEKRFSHVARGGAWSDPANACRSTTRVGSTKEWIKHDPCRPQSIWWLTQWDVVGFRVVRPLQEYEQLKGLKSKVTKQSE
jgi:formylglycine-generating enzyme required for sulfatase activity